MDVLEIGWNVMINAVVIVARICHQNRVKEVYRNKVKEVYHHGYREYYQ